ncbi:MAG: hypothetical protein ABIQ36_10720 [Rhodanobacter sp.]
MSDLEEFIRKHKPGTKRSRLFPHLPAIHRLRAEGFSFDQVCQYLSEKGVPISVSGLSSFLKRHEGIGRDAQGQGTAAPPMRPSADVPGESSPSAMSPPELDGLGKKQRRERLADQFIKPQTSNPLLKRIKENKA